MLNINHQKFLELDQLSRQKVPFFFVIDFLMENVLIFNEEDLKLKKILVDFPHFKNIENKEFASKNKLLMTGGSNFHGLYNKTLVSIGDSEMPHGTSTPVGEMYV